MVQDAPALARLALVKSFSSRERLDHFDASEFRDAVLISVITASHNLRISNGDRTNVCAARSSSCWGGRFQLVWFRRYQRQCHNDYPYQRFYSCLGPHCQLVWRCIFCGAMEIFCWRLMPRHVHVLLQETKNRCRSSQKSNGMLCRIVGREFEIKSEVRSSVSFWFILLQNVLQNLSAVEWG